MRKVMPGKFTAAPDQPFVVFLIGMRVNNVFAVTSWFPISMLMSPMLSELYREKELGFLGGEFFFNLRGITLLQYWRSFEDLERYAKGELHMRAWKRFYEKVGKSHSVGIWHETYVIEPGKYESFYGNMPVFGLANATDSHTPIHRHNQTAQDRITRNR